MVRLLIGPGDGLPIGLPDLPAVCLRGDLPNAMDGSDGCLGFGRGKGIDGLMGLVPVEGHTHGCGLDVLADIRSGDLDNHEPSR